MKAAPLAIPESVLKQHVVVLGKTGAGKSSVLRHMVEWLLSKGKRVCIIDPKGDWHGLPSSADGQHPGFPVVLFGDFKNKRSDVPMDARAGKDVAQIIASSDQACVLGFRGWMPGALTTFWLDFAPALFNTNQGELYLVIDEVHNFAPKGKILSPQSGEMLHWTNRLASEGRGLGLKLLIASQRPQKVHNDTLTCCETLVAMRVVHPADRAALKEWMDECGDAAKGKDVLSEVASMKTGQAWVWFPDGGFLEKVQFPMFRTFDSFSEHATQTPRQWAKVDVEAVREKLARVVEAKKQNDPAELRTQITKLKTQNAKLETDLAKLREAKPEGLSEADRKLIEGVKDAARELLAPMPSLQESLQKLVGKEMAIRIIPPKPSFMTRIPEIPDGKGFKYEMKGPVARSTPPIAQNGTVTGGRRRMMIALAQRPGLSKRQLGVRAGLSSESGTFGTYLAAMRTAGHLTGTADGLQLTQDGLHALGHYEPLPTGQALCDYWMRQVGGGASRMLQVLTERHGFELSREELGERAGISPTSGTFGTYLSKLRTLELVSRSFPISASDELFD